MWRLLYLIRYFWRMSDSDHLMPRLNPSSHNGSSDDKNKNAQPHQNPTHPMLFSIRGSHRERHRHRTSSHDSYGEQRETSQNKTLPPDVTHRKPHTNDAFLFIPQSPATTKQQPNKTYQAKQDIPNRTKHTMQN